MSGTYLQIPPGGGGGGGTITGVLDTDSIDLTVTGSDLTADLNLSADPADAGFFKATASIETDGLLVQAEEAAAGQTGFLTGTDWSTFNAKEPAISAGTTSQYWRGDKSFQTLDVAALLATVAGTAAGSGQVGEVLTATQATNTTTGVGATGVYGAATSIALTAGAYYVTGTAGFNENGAVLEAGLQAGISASATGVGLSEFDTALTPALISSTSDTLLATPGVFVDIAAPTTYYLNTKFTYSAGSPRHRGRIKAWRIR